MTHPFISVVIPVRNEGKYIGACLASLLQTRYPSDRWEIVIGDGMSEDATRAEVARVAQSSPVPITLLDNPRRVTPIGLNLAIGAARGEIVIRVDAHAAYPADYIARCAQVLAESGADNVGGPIETRPGGDSCLARAIAASLSHPFGVGSSAFRTRREAMEVDTVPFGCFRAEVFRRLGLFDERLWRNHDYEFNRRLHRAGGRIYMDPRLTSIYYSRGTLGGYARQSWQNGRWVAFMHYLHPASFHLRHAAPVLFVLGLLPFWGLLGWGSAAVWLRAGLLGVAALYALYLLLAVGVALRLGARWGWATVPLLLLLFPVLHATYGAGIAWGWGQVLLRRHPWRREDGIPRWEERRVAR